MEKNVPAPLTFGSSGCFICLQTACLASFAWPCSPLLSGYICCQRTSFRNIYDQLSSESIEDSRNGTLFSHRADTLCQDFMDSCFFRPYVLLQHLSFINQKNEDGILFFDWAEDSFQGDQKKRVVPAVGNKVAILIGPKGCGKSTLFRKLLGINYDQKKDLLRDHLRTQTGVTCTGVSEEGVDFLEIWDVPIERLPSPNLEIMASTVCAVLFVFDCTGSSKIRHNNEDDAKNGNNDFDMETESSFREMKLIYEDFVSSNAEQLSKNRIIQVCVASRIDLLENDKDLELKINELKVKYNLLGGSGDSQESGKIGKLKDFELQREIAKETKEHFILNEKVRMNLHMAETWARENNLKYIETSSATNTGIIDLIKYLRFPFSSTHKNSAKIF